MKRRHLNLAALAVWLACFGFWVALVWALASAPAQAAEPIKPGMRCIVPEGWFSLDPEKPIQPEPVRVVKLQQLYTAEPAAWVQPLRGPQQGHQYQLALRLLSECRP